jgi:hypothetical protein
MDFAKYLRKKSGFRVLPFGKKSGFHVPPFGQKSGFHELGRLPNIVTTMVKVMVHSWIMLRLLSQLPSTFALLPQRIPLNRPLTRWFRSGSSLGMGIPWYGFKAVCSSGNAIMVTNNDIKETHRPGSSKEDVPEDTHNSREEEDKDEDEEDEDEDENLFYARLDEEDVEWLLDRAPEYSAYQIGESFVLFTKGHNGIRETPRLDVPGSYNMYEPCVRCCIEEAPKGEEYNELFELACKFTPPWSKLSFAPGMYSLAATTPFLIKVKQLKRSDSSSDGTSNLINSADDGMDAPAPTVPFDFELIVGNGDEKKTIGVNRALFFYCFPHVETKFGDACMDTKLELPELDPQAVERVLKVFSSRKDVAKPYHPHNEYKAFEKVQRAFGKSMKEMANGRFEHPAIADPRWLDATFLVGPQREEIKVNRSVLASMNPVLYRVLFGTGLSSVDPFKPIEWPDYDAQDVRQVFLALLHFGKKDIVVPMERVESVKMLVEYLEETREALMLYYDTPFKREYQGIFLLDIGEDGEGLKLSERSDSTWF